MQKEELLVRTKIFSSLGSGELAMIAANSAYERFGPERPVFVPGAPGDCMYIVVEGEVEIVADGAADGKPGAVRNDSDPAERAGDKRAIANLVEGDTFGELELFTGIGRNARALVLKDTLLLRFPLQGSSIENLMESAPNIMASVLYAFLNVLSGRMRRAINMVRENSAVTRELRRQVYGDRQTGLWNKTYLEETLPELLRARDAKAGLVLLKPDNFKEINDSLGHSAGDATLRLMAAELARRAEGKGEAIRYLGNEMGVVYAGYGRSETIAEAENLRKAFRDLDISSVTGRDDFRLTVSVGVGACPEDAADPNALIALVHDLPLRGRALGGDMVVLAGEGDPRDAAPSAGVRA